MASFVGGGARDTVLALSVRSLSESFETQRMQLEQYLGDAGSACRELLRLLEALRCHVGESPALPPWSCNFISDELRRVSEAVEGFRRPSSFAVVATALESWTDVLARMRDDASTTALANPLTEAVLALRTSSALLARLRDPVAAYAVECSIALTDVEIRAAHDFVLMAAAHRGEGTLDPSPFRLLLVPRYQRGELQRVAAALEGLDIEGLLGLIPTGQVVLIAHELLALVLDINESRRTTSSAPIFETTARFVRVIAELPFASASDRYTFADLIDDLYVLLYEAAGSDALRYLGDHGGPLIADRCGIVFVIRRLRNHLRHDPERGNSREIATNLDAVRADLVARGLNGLPRTRHEYRRLHRVLLEEAVAFLRTLREAPQGEPANC